MVVASVVTLPSTFMGLVVEDLVPVVLSRLTGFHGNHKYRIYDYDSHK